MGSIYSALHTDTSSDDEDFRTKTSSKKTAKSRRGKDDNSVGATSHSSEVSASSSDESSSYKSSVITSSSESDDAASSVHSSSLESSSISGSDSEASVSSVKKKKKSSAKKHQSSDESLMDTPIKESDLDSPATPTVDKKKVESDESDMEVDVQKEIKKSSDSESEKKEEEEEKPKKPVPVRRPSAIKIEEETKSEPSQPPKAPEKPPVKIPKQSPIHILDHDYAKPAPVSSDEEVVTEHGYSKMRSPPAKKIAEVAKTKKPPLKSLVKPLVSRQTSIAVPQRRERTFKPRDYKSQFELMYKFLSKGLDLEDINYLKRSYYSMTYEDNEDKKLFFVNETHWVDHTITDIPDPPKKKRKEDFSRAHKTGKYICQNYIEQANCNLRKIFRILAIATLTHKFFKT